MSFIDPMGLSFASDFGSNFGGDLNSTNSFFFSFPDSLSRTGIGAATGSANVVADTIGGVTPLQALASVPNGGLAVYGGVGGTLLAGATGWLANTAVVAGTLEVGIIIGTTITATGESLLYPSGTDSQPKPGY
jgi:hypothetical protein